MTCSRGASSRRLPRRPRRLPKCHIETAPGPQNAGSSLNLFHCFPSRLARPPAHTGFPLALPRPQQSAACLESRGQAVLGLLSWAVRGLVALRVLAAVPGLGLSRPLSPSGEGSRPRRPAERLSQLPIPPRDSRAASQPDRQRAAPKGVGTRCSPASGSPSLGAPPFSGLPRLSEHAGSEAPQRPGAARPPHRDPGPSAQPGRHGKGKGLEEVQSLGLAPTVTALQAAPPSQVPARGRPTGTSGSRGQTARIGPPHTGTGLGPRPTQGSEPLMMGVNVALPPRG